MAGMEGAAATGAGELARQEFELEPKDLDGQKSSDLQQLDGLEWLQPTQRVGGMESNYAYAGPMTLRDRFNKLIWHGGSVYDAWLNASSAQVGQVILSMPTSYAQMGMALAIVFHLFYVVAGIWTCYLLARLYVEYRHRKEIEGADFKRHVIQYHEVLGYLVGPWAQRCVLFFNVMSMGAVCTVQVIACASNAYYLSNRLDKQQWTLLFGGLSMFVALVPTFHNFRLISFIGILTTSYTAWYMFISSLRHGQAADVKHSGLKGITLFFTGTTNILFATGGHGITVEIMHAMWQPRKYKYVYLWTCVYVMSITMPHCIAIYWAFGDVLLTHSNAFSVLPPSHARSTGLAFMIIHQAVAFGMYVMPLFFMWEKLFGIHTAWFPLRVIMRLPVIALIWFLALAFPFFGPLNSVIGAMFSSFSTFIIPCIAYIVVFWTPEARQNAGEKLSRYMPGWKGMLVINAGLAVLVGVLGSALGSYASIANIVKQVKTFGLFDKCYQCRN